MLVAPDPGENIATGLIPLAIEALLDSTCHSFGVMTSPLTLEPINISLLRSETTLS